MLQILHGDREAMCVQESRQKSLSGLTLRCRSIWGQLNRWKCSFLSKRAKKARRSQLAMTSAPSEKLLNPSIQSRETLEHLVKEMDVSPSDIIDSREVVSTPAFCLQVEVPTSRFDRFGSV